MTNQPTPPMAYSPNNFRLLAFAPVLICALTFITMQPALAQTFSVLHTFTGGADGGKPFAGLTLDAGGDLYGTTGYQGEGSNGVVFKLAHRSSNWTLSIIYDWPNNEYGSLPLSRLMMAPDGSLLGTTGNGGGFCGGSNQGCGTVFRLLPPPPGQCGAVNCLWTLAELHIFGYGGFYGDVPSYGDIVLDAAGTIFGTTLYGGHGVEGVVYEISRSHTFQVIHEFTDGPPGGAFPSGGLTMDSAGNLYGTTQDGGAHQMGDVYELSFSARSGWTETVLHSFDSTDGANPFGGVIFGPDGVLYGSTLKGFSNGCGGVFQLTFTGGSWELTTLYNFNSSGQQQGGPAGKLTIDAAGNLYGTTLYDGAYSQGSAFKLTRSNGGWLYTNLHDFTGGNDGGQPYGQVAIDANGNLYGTASIGGPNDCEGGDTTCGVVWEIMP